MSRPCAGASPMTHFVFTLTTGRSGTLYLAELLAQNLPDAECYHEIVGFDRFGVDTPDVSHMTLFNSQGNVDKVQAFWRAKLARIAGTPRQFYVETSHLLMKAGLIENLAPLTAKGTVHLIALERDTLATLLSFRKRLDFVHKSNQWLWYLDPDYPVNLVPSAELVAAGINGLCLWYILEIRARVAYYERLVAGKPNIVFHRFSLEALQTAQGAARLLQALGVAQGSRAGDRSGAAQRRPGPGRGRCRGRGENPGFDQRGGVDAAVRSRARPSRPRADRVAARLLQPDPASPYLPKSTPG